MAIDSARVVIVIRAIRDAVLADRMIGTPESTRWVDPQGCEIVRRACEENAVTLDEWLAVLRTDVEIARLFEATLDELMLEPPDPGPYDAISRESASGSAEADRDAFERDARLLGKAGR